MRVHVISCRVRVHGPVHEDEMSYFSRRLCVFPGRKAIYLRSQEISRVVEVQIDSNRIIMRCGADDVSMQGVGECFRGEILGSILVS